MSKWFRITKENFEQYKGKLLDVSRYDEEDGKHIVRDSEITLKYIIDDYVYKENSYFFDIKKRWFRLSEKQEEKMSEEQKIKELVEKFNSGLDAFRELQKIKNIDDKISRKDEFPIMSCGNFYDAMLEIKSQVKELDLNNYKVVVEGDNVNIGCKQFKLDLLKTALNDLLKHDYSSKVIGKETLIARRKGITTEYPSEGISWDDAEKLFNWLREI